MYNPENSNNMIFYVVLIMFRSQNLFNTDNDQAIMFMGRGGGGSWGGQRGGPGGSGGQGAQGE